VSGRTFMGHLSWYFVFCRGAQILIGLAAIMELCMCMAPSPLPAATTATTATTVDVYCNPM
jgi:hypothetical protein